MRFPRTLVACALLLAMVALAACSGNNASGGATASQGGSSSGGEQSNQASPSASSSESGGGGGGGSSADLAALVTALTPPNSSQITRTDATGGTYIAWESTDSADSLKSFYEKAIPDSGMKIFTTSTTSGTTTWVFAKTEGSSFGGSVTVGPSSTGGSGSNVILAATSQ